MKTSIQYFTYTLSKHPLFFHGTTKMSKANPGVFDQIKQTQKQTYSKINLHIDPGRDPSRGKVDFLMGEAITLLNITLSGLS